MPNPEANVLIFSMFGDYLSFSATNTDRYMELFKLFSDYEYYPSIINQFFMKGQMVAPDISTMPFFYKKDHSAMVEITLDRINFTVKLERCETVDELKKKFEDELFDIFKKFIDLTDIKANRLAINCSISKRKQEDISKFLSTSAVLSNYFKDLEDQAIRNMKQEVIEEELTNVSVELSAAKDESFIFYLFDVNSLLEHSEMRFSKKNMQKIFEMYLSKILEIEKSLR